MKFAHNLKSLRREAGLTQQMLAKKSGLTRSAISMYESGLREPNFEDLDRLADALDIDIGSLVGSKAGRGTYPRHGDTPRRIAVSVTEIQPGVSHAVVLSKDEQQVLKALRRATPDRRHAVRVALGLVGKAKPVKTTKIPPSAMRRAKLQAKKARLREEAAAKAALKRKSVG